MAVNPKCVVISIMGGKGGVGKSVFAANFATAAAMELRQPTLLIDLDSKSCGDQSIITGLKPLMTMGELIEKNPGINPTTLSRIVARHPTGMHYLGAVRNPTETLMVSPELAIKQIESFSHFFPFIVLDLGSDFNELQAAAVDISTTVFVVTTPEILAVTQTARLVKELSINNYPAELVQVVVNKASPTGLAPQSIEKTLERRLIAVVPQDDNTVMASVARSQMFVSGQTSLPISGSYIECFRRLTSGGYLQRLQTIQRPKTNRTPQHMAIPTGKPAHPGAHSPRTRESRPLDPHTLMKMRIHEALLIEMDLKNGITNTKGDPQKELKLRQDTQQSISKIIDREFPDLVRNERAQIMNDVLNEALGLGPLEALLADDAISEIMVNGPYKIFIEKNGKIQLSSITFTSNLQLRNVISRIVTPLGRQINENSPYVDARLKDGSRVNAVIEPIAIDGAAVTIRKFRKSPVVPQNYVDWQSMTQPMIDFLRICVENGLNVIVSGGTGSGKTTLLNVLSSFIPASERVVTVEDAAELQLKQEHVVRLETRPPNMEGAGEISIRDLVRNALRMRPDRIVVGECRGGEALDMLSAMNTGHDGSMTTVHANNPKEAIRRLETLCMMAGLNLPAVAIREQIVGAVDLIIQISRLSDGSRKIVDITEVVGMQQDVPTLQPIFLFVEKGFDKNRKIVGEFMPQGFMPTFLPEFAKKGIHIPPDLFKAQPRPAAPGAHDIKKVGGGTK